MHLLAVLLLAHGIAGSRIEPLPRDPGIHVLERNGRYGYVDNAGRWLLPPRFAAAQPFNEGLAAVAVQTGDCPVAAVHAGDAWDVAAAALAWLRILAGLEERRSDCGKLRWGYIDRTGRTVIPHRYELAMPFIGGTAWVRGPGDRENYRIDRRGNRVL